MIAFTNQIESSKRPITVVILAVLTFISVIPPIAEQWAERFIHPLEVAFVYGTAPHPVIVDFLTFLIDITLLSVCMISGIGLVKRQRWAWFVALGLYVAVFSVHLVASIWVGYDQMGQIVSSRFVGSYGLYASMVISLAALCLLLKKDVRIYLLSVPKKSS